MIYLTPIIPILLGILAGYFLTLPILVFLSIVTLAIMVLYNLGEGMEKLLGCYVTILGGAFLISLWLTAAICLDWLPEFVTNFRAFR